MHHARRLSSIITGLTALAIATVLPALPTEAQNPVTFAFTGTVTSVDDTFNFFQNTYAVSTSLTGTCTFSDSGYQNGFYLINTLQAVTAAPEPTSLLLLALAGTLMIARRRKATHE